MKFQFLPIYEPSIVTKYDHKGALLNQTCDPQTHTLIFNIQGDGIGRWCINNSVMKVEPSK